MQHTNENENYCRMHQKWESAERDGAGEPDAGQRLVPGEQDGED